MSDDTAAAITELVRARRRRLARDTQHVAHLLEQREWASANAAARSLTLTGCLAGAPTLVRAFTSSGAAEVVSKGKPTNWPNLKALWALLRRHVSGSIPAARHGLKHTAAALLALRLEKAPERLNAFVTAAALLVMADDIDQARVALRRAEALLDEIRGEAPPSAPVAASIADLAFVAVLIDEFGLAIRAWEWVRGNVDDATSAVVGQAEFGLALVNVLLGWQSRVTSEMLAFIDTGDPGDLGFGAEWGALVRTARAWRLIDRGRPDDALVQTRAAVGMVAEPQLIGAVVAANATANIAAGRPGAARQFLEGVISRSAPVDIGSATGARRYGLAAAAAALCGDSEGGKALLEDVRESRLVSIGRSIVHLASPEVDPGVVMAPSAQRALVPLTGPRLAIIEWLAFAAVQLAAGHSSVAAAVLERVSDIAQNEDVHYYGYMLPAASASTLAALAAERDLPEVAHDLRHARAQTRLNAPALTAREWEVLELVAGGLTNSEIANRLFLSPNTVKYHLTRVFRRWGVSSREEALALAVATHGSRFDALGEAIVVNQEPENPRASG